MKRLSTPGFIALALLLASTASAQEQPQESSTEITVTAPKIEWRQVERQARSITPKPGGDYLREPLPRFESPLCPGVFGIRDDAALAIVDRVRFRIGQIDLPLGEAGNCRANVLIAFVPDAAGQVSQLKEDRHFLLADLTFQERKLLKEDFGPVYAWSTTSLRDRHGNLAQGDPPQVQTESSTRLQLAIRRDIELSVVVIDHAAAVGKTLDQLADYAAMRALARTRPPADGSADTVLTLFTPGAVPPAQMTAFDVAYLKSLYTARANESAITKMSRIARTMREGMEAAAP